MATFRLSSKLVSPFLKNNNFSAKSPLLWCSSGRVTQVAFIAHKNHIDPEILARKPKPWPYETRKFWFAYEWLKLDRTISRFDENTKVITIDGTVAAGKKEFGKKLAEELGMRYFPQPDIDDLYVDYRGFNYCTLNPSLPEKAQFINLKMLNSNPKHPGIPQLQYQWYMFRCFIYFDALAHLYSTGQGVIVDRNPWSDLVFVETMFKQGMLNKSCRDFFWRLRKVTSYPLQKPHVCIYLDITPEESLKRIKARNGVDANSKYVNKAFLETLDDFYKNMYLKEIEEHAEVLVYDWSNHGDVDVVVEDLEKLDFDKYEYTGSKMKDWRLYEEEMWVNQRLYYNNYKEVYLAEFNVPTYDVEGLDLDHKTAEICTEVVGAYAPNDYNPKFDPKIHGWFKVMFLNKDNYRSMQNRPWHIVVKE